MRYLLLAADSEDAGFGRTILDLRSKVVFLEELSTGKCVASNEGGEFYMATTFEELLIRLTSERVIL